MINFNMSQLKISLIKNLEKRIIIFCCTIIWDDLDLCATTYGSNNKKSLCWWAHKSVEDILGLFTAYCCVAVLTWLWWSLALFSSVNATVNILLLYLTDTLHDKLMMVITKEAKKNFFCSVLKYWKIIRKLLCIFVCTFYGKKIKKMHPFIHAIHSLRKTQFFNILHKRTRFHI